MTDTQATAAPNEKRGGMGKTFMAVIISTLMLLLVFPGFIAGMLSRMDAVYFLFGDDWIYSNDIVLAPIAKSVLFPSTQMMKNSTTIRRFYVWQYELAGGKTIVID